MSALIVATLLSSACGNSRPSTETAARVLPSAAALPSDADATEKTIRFLEDRVSRDHDDFIAYNKLAGYYLQRQRDTGSLSFLDLAFRAARSSLVAMPAEQNLGGLTALAQAENISHDFAASRDHALKLVKLDSGKSYPYQMLGDALLELGDYDQANAAFLEMKKRGSGAGIETRMAKFALLSGDYEVARRHFTNAVAFALDQRNPSRETVAWCRWQLGEVAFSIGDYKTAEQHYRDALVMFPNYYRALASLARVRAAQGDLQDGIENYERAIQIIPEPTFVAALGDLYKLAGRDKEAEAQYGLVEQIGKLNAANGALYNRQLALFYADHDLNIEEAYAYATKEYVVRRDIYGADVVAWAALKAGKTTEAQAVIKEALKLDTRDARLFYHAGMIALASGDRANAREYLKRALALNPQFDPLQAINAKKAFEAINE